ncbi:MAG: hypothetical protein AAGF20_12655 [Pseudomonadota bacterium]
MSCPNIHQMTEGEKARAYGTANRYRLARHRRRVRLQRLIQEEASGPEPCLATLARLQSEHSTLVQDTSQA